MRRWLITTSSDEDLGKLRKDLEAEGGEISDAPPIPLDGGEQAIEVEGPDDLPEKLRSHPAVRKVSPDSNVHLY